MTADPRPPRWREVVRRRLPSGDRGASAVELAILMPVILICILLVVQLALIFHGRQVADIAAREGARVARAAGVGDDAGNWQAAAESRAREKLRIAGQKIMTNTTVQAWQVGDQRGVTVTGEVAAAVPLLPGMSFGLTAKFGGPIECFRPDDGSVGCG